MSSSTPSDADIVFARANVALARSQRLIASWLPPKTDHELGITKTDEEIEREEQEIFTPVPELYVPSFHLMPGQNNPRLIRRNDLMKCF